MPRVKGTANIRPWRAEQLIRDLAVGDKPYAELAADHDVEEQTIAVFKIKHRAEISAVLADMVDKCSHIWEARKEVRVRILALRYREYQDRIDELYEHARRETETIRSVEPEASEVPIDLDKFCKIDIQQRKILREIADELGQLVSRSAPDNSAAAPMLHHVVEGINLAEALGIVSSPRPPVEPIPVTAPVDLESKDETMRTPFRVNPPPAAPEPEPANLHAEQPVDVQVVPAKPVQPDHVTRGARAIAEQVWSSGSKPRSRFFAGQNEVAQADTEQALNHAINVGWIAGEPPLGVE